MCILNRTREAATDIITGATFKNNLSMTEIKWMGSQTDFISYGDDKESACNCAESGFNRRGDGGL